MFDSKGENRDERDLVLREKEEKRMRGRKKDRLICKGGTGKERIEIGGGKCTPG